MGESSYRKMRIAVIGAGNVSTHLTAALAAVENVVQIFSRNLENAKLLAEKTGVKSYTGNLEDITAEADLYIISVKDDAISGIVAKLSELNKNAVWVHTSGSTGCEVFENSMPKNGVFYPLQTFSKNAEVNVAEVPFLLEASDNQSLEMLKALASKISEKVYEADSVTRRRLHIAAVFACNFANNLWRISDELLKEYNLSMDVFLPLLKVSVEKLGTLSPEDAQTGPAMRGDVHIIENHLKELSGENREIYRLMSDSILKHYKR